MDYRYAKRWRSEENVWVGYFTIENEVRTPQQVRDEPLAKCGAGIYNNIWLKMKSEYIYYI